MWKTFIGNFDFVTRTPNSELGGWFKYLNLNLNLSLNLSKIFKSFCCDSIHMMSQINAPIHSYKNPYKCMTNTFSKTNYYTYYTFNFFLLANETRYIDLDVNLRSSLFNDSDLISEGFVSEPKLVVFENTSFNNLCNNHSNSTPCSNYFQVYSGGGKRMLSPPPP